MIKGPVNSVINWNYFCLNFSSNFIKECWNKEYERDVVLHLEIKFSQLYEKRGTGLMPFFFSELSRHNQIRLVRFVNETYVSFPDLITEDNE